MKHKAFFSSCRQLQALLDASPDEIPDVTRFLEGGDDPVRGKSLEDRSPAEELVAAVKATLRYGFGAGASYRTAARLFRRARTYLLKLGLFVPAQELESEWWHMGRAWLHRERKQVVPPAAVPAAQVPAAVAPALVVVPTVAPVVVPPPPPLRQRPPQTLRLSQSQRKCVARLLALAELFFDPPPAALRGIPIQTNTLLTGGAGSGKTSSAQRVAEDLGADFLHLTHGSWIVEGSADGYPTVRTILHRAAYSDRLVLFIDELDKFSLSSASPSSWDISIRSDLWMLLDRGLSWGSLAAKNEYMKSLPENLRSASALEEMFKTRVFIIAAGTWQELLRPPAVVGFGAQASTLTLDAATLNRHGGLPEEVLRRFNSDLIHLEYPSFTEFENLVVLDGLLDLARELGREIDLAALYEEVKGSGLAVLCSLKTSLLVEQKWRGHGAKPRIAVAP